MSNQLLVRRAAVLGAGVMGAQIAAHLTNAGVDTVLFDLAAKEGAPNGIVDKAIANLAKLSPAPLASKALAERLTAANYDTGLEQLRSCDLVIEAIAERMDWKQDLYKKIAAYVPEHAVLASNTSGLGINKLAEVLPEELRHRFLGVHFFNPPRYMHLAELIPAKTTDAAVLEGLETFLTTTLGKGVVIAKDTPNFIGNRIGVFSMLAAMHHTEQFGLGFDTVDALTGPAIGRPKSATWSAWTPWPTSSRPWPTPCPTTRGTRTSRRPSGSAPWSRRARWGRRPAPASTPRRARTSWCWTSRPRITASPPASSTPRSRRC